MSNLNDEILEQPQALNRLLSHERQSVQAIAQIVNKAKPRYIVLAARGSSDNAARYGQYLFGAINHLPVALATPSLFTLYNSPPILTGALVIAISQSGQSPDICTVVQSGREQGALTIAITNEPGAPLASAAEHCIDLCAGPERSIAATKTYTNSLLALAMLSTAMSGSDHNYAEMARLPLLAEKLLADQEPILRSAAQFRNASACVTIGRGYNYSTAFEIALKLKELTYLPAEPYSSADFLHGPVAIVQDGFLVIAVIPKGKPSAELKKLIRALRRRGAEIYLLAPEIEGLTRPENFTSLPAKVPEWLSPVLAVIPGQIFALGLAKARGVDPELPRGLMKVTRTR